MQKYLTQENAATLARIAALGLLAFFTSDFSPALAATLSRSMDIGAALSAARSIVGPFCSASDWWRSPGCARDSRNPTSCDRFHCRGSAI